MTAGLAPGAEEGPRPETPSLSHQGRPEPREGGDSQQTGAAVGAIKGGAPPPAMAVGQGVAERGDLSAAWCGPRRHPYCGPTPAPSGPGRHPSPQWCVGRRDHGGGAEQDGDLDSL